jgi:hypothetical protein
MNIFALFAASLLGAAVGAPLTAETPASNEETAKKIIEMEKTALSRWIKGDPGGFLEISAKDVVYFDPALKARLDGLDALKSYYHPLQGKALADRFELLNPLVQVGGNMAVLTFNFVSQAGDKAHRWNCTEVYRCDDGQWRIIKTHWSPTQPML